MVVRACERGTDKKNALSENQVVYYIIVTERKAMQDEQAKFYCNISGCACARGSEINECTCL